MNETDITIVGIEGLIYGVTDVSLCERYMRDWGFEPVAGHVHRFRTLEGTWVELQPHDHPALPTLRHASPVF